MLSISAIKPNNLSFQAITPIRTVMVADSFDKLKHFKEVESDKDLKSTRMSLKRVLIKRDKYEGKNIFIKACNESIRQLLALKIKDYQIKIPSSYSIEDISFFHHANKCFLLTGKEAQQHHKVGATLGRAKANLNKAIESKDDDIDEHKKCVEEYERYYRETLDEFYKKADSSKQLNIYGVRKKTGGIQVLNVNF